MNIRKALAAAAVTILTFSANAQTTNRIDHTAASCVRGGELPLFQVTTHTKGELRGYFRRVNTTDWCSVEGTNDGPLSRVVLPKFQAGDEVEYFFVVIDGGHIVSRSPKIYRVRVTGECETAWARHLIRLEMRCGDDEQSIPAGYAVGDIGKPKPISPDRPENQ